MAKSIFGVESLLCLNITRRKVLSTSLAKYSMFLLGIDCWPDDDSLAAVLSTENLFLNATVLGQSNSPCG